MSRGKYSAGKRARDIAKSKKKQEKAEKRWVKREEGTHAIPIADVVEVTGDQPDVKEATPAERAAMGAKTIPCRLFVGSLSWDTTDDDLIAAFGEYGKVAEAVVVNDRDTGRSRGFGFVTMANRKDATKAIDELHESELQGRVIVVNVATERSR